MSLCLSRDGDNLSPGCGAKQGYQNKDRKMMKTTVFCENFCLVQKVKGRENEAGVGEASSLFVALALVWARPA